MHYKIQVSIYQWMCNIYYWSLYSLTLFTVGECGICQHCLLDIIVISKPISKVFDTSYDMVIYGGSPFRGIRFQKLHLAPNELLWPPDLSFRICQSLLNYFVLNCNQLLCLFVFKTHYISLSSINSILLVWEPVHCIFHSHYCQRGRKSDIVELLRKC